MWALLLRTACVVVAALALAGESAAQPESPERHTTMAVDFGFGGSLVAERWNPVRISIDAGEHPLSGIVVAEFQQDTTQATRVQAAFSAVPGSPTIVTLAIAPPRYCSEVTFRLIDSTGRERIALTYSELETNLALAMPSILSSDHALVATLGRSSCFESMKLFRNRVSDDLKQNGGAISVPPGTSEIAKSIDWGSATVVSCLPEQIPPYSIAYGSLLAIVVNAESTRSLDPRTADAIHEWVRAGGRLVVLAQSPGADWTRWLPPEAASCFSIDESISIAPPASLVKALKMSIKEWERENLKSARDDAPEPAATFDARPIRLRPDGVARGWKKEYAIDDSRAIMAHGPVGLGYVTVLAADPQRFWKTLSTQVTIPFWLDALAPSLAGVPARSTDPAMRYVDYSTASGAISATVQNVANVPDIGLGSFAFIGFGMLALALLVGPIDYFVLKRLRAGHRSWFTAIAWTTLITLVAYLVPRALRSEPTRIDRLNVVDAIAAPFRASDAEAPIPSWNASVTGIYSASTGLAAVRSEAREAWTRGVGVEAEPYYFGSRSKRSSLGTISVAQETLAADSTRVGAIQSLPLSIWTFRALLENARGPTFHAQIRFTGDRASVMVQGLPPGAIVDRASMHRVREVYRAAEEPIGNMDGDVWSATFVIDSDAPQPATRKNPPKPPYWNAVNIPSNEELDRVAFQLPGPDRRTLAAETLASAGWCELRLHVRNLPQTFMLDRATDHSDAAEVRLLVPPAAIEGAVSGESP